MCSSETELLSKNVSLNSLFSCLLEGMCVLDCEISPAEESIRYRLATATESVYTHAHVRFL